ncbi:DUF5719 family protein [Brachybacterium sp. GCM10030267]|uniref:DUF5719 family protein n=1 Tax=Brachybacterium sp. GCM10030267 TaxID=3273381 RepID=UPI003616AEF1
MAESDLHTDRELAPSRRAPHGGPWRPLLALAALIPLAAAVGAIAATPGPEPTTLARAEAQSQPGATSLQCPGPLTLPEELLAEGPDADLAVTPPTETVDLSSVALEPESSLLFGEVSASETLQEDDGSVRAPDIVTEGSDGTALQDRTAAQDLGAGVQAVTGIEDSPVVRAATSQGGRPVADTVQSTATDAGDYRSLSLTRCAEPTTDASFLGVSTATGDSSALVLRNPTQRPATASVQVWTEDGPAAMEGRSQVVVAPGAEERVLLESVAGGHDVVGVRTTSLGAPLAMHVQTTERDGLTPGGAEILQPLAPAAEEQVMPGVEVAGTPPVLVLANPEGADTTASVDVAGDDGPVDEAALEDVEVPAGAVVSVPLESLGDGTFSVSVTSADPVLAVTRSSATGADLPGDTVGSPVNFTLVGSAPAIASHAITALPAEGAAGELTLAATADSAVTVIPIAADGSAGDPVRTEVSEGGSTSVVAADLEIDGQSAAGLTVVPDVPGAVHATWMQRESDGAGGVLLSALPVHTARSGGDPLTVRLQE